MRRLAALLLALPAALPGQELLRELDTRERALQPGLRLFTAVDRQGGASTAYEALKVEPRAFAGSLRLDPGGDTLLARAQERRGALALLGLEPGVPGPVAEWGRVARWPAEGPLLIVDAEGSFRLADPPPGAPSLRTGSGSETALGIGASAPAPRIIPGPLDRALIIDLVKDQPDSFIIPFPGVWNGSGAAPGPAFDALRIDGAARSLEWNEALLQVELPPSEEGGLVLLDGVPAAVATAQLAVPAGEWLLRAGEEVPGPEPDLRPAARTVVGVDGEGALWLLAVPREFAGQTGARRGALARFLLEHGVRDAALAHPREAALLPDLRDEATMARRGAVEAGAVLVLDAAPAVRTLPDGSRWGRAAMREATTGGVAFDAHPPRALFDGRSQSEDGGGALFAAAAPGGAPFAVRLRLARRGLVAAIDVAHASAAGLDPSLDLGGATVSLRSSGDAAWIAVGEVGRRSGLGRERIAVDPPIEATEVRIDILEPNRLPGGDVARIAEVTVWTLEQP
ncbi:MAG: phosphodiester glycosidase family protein [Candidatus Sumerlaeia bacterium]|nr:phosphodiester glycosidase family protein [Candidatus Sumerlaeia bacterium]